MAIIRAGALKQIGGYWEDFKTSQDIDLWLRIGEVGASRIFLARS